MPNYNASSYCTINTVPVAECSIADPVKTQRVYVPFEGVGIKVCDQPLAGSASVLYGPLYHEWVVSWTEGDIIRICAQNPDWSLEAQARITSIRHSVDHIEKIKCDPCDNTNEDYKFINHYRASFDFVLTTPIKGE